MRILLGIFLTSLVGFGLYWGYTHYPQMHSKITDLVQGGKFQTLEVRHNADVIMENHKRTLLKDAQHSFLEPSLTFHPYLLMEVKYTLTDSRTGEGIILWSLVDGEMVINTATWEKTHGFKDYIQTSADKNDFKILNALSYHGGILDRETLFLLLNVENDVLDRLIDNAKKKNFIVLNGNNYRLHLKSPRMPQLPETRIDQWLVTKPTKNAARVARRFRPTQIERAAKAAFGNDFAIRSTSEILLPVFSVTVQNPDGSQMTTFWNALNGKRFPNTYHID